MENAVDEILQKAVADLVNAIEEVVDQEGNASEQPELKLWIDMVEEDQELEQEKNSSASDS